ILSTCRIPGPKRDTVVHYSAGKTPPSHITVVHNFQSRVAAQVLHGGGTRWNSGNRWFDKTLQVGSKTDCVMCFGPMVPDGYGVCYNPMDEHINIAITAFNSCEDTNAANFAEAVKKALLDMRALLTETAATRP
ncbi:hypothetical protein XENOCAPTIV_018847, partial [Xenoophorus captivus]